MLALLMLANCLAVIFVIFLWSVLVWRYRLLFLAGSLLPLLVGAVLALIHEHTVLPFESAMDIVGFFFRGWFIACITCGTLACYIATQLKK